MRPGKLIEQPRFPDSWFTHYRDYLAVPRALAFSKAPLESIHGLGITPHEARKSACCCGFHARSSNESSPRNFINFHRLS